MACVLHHTKNEKDRKKENKERGTMWLVVKVPCIVSNKLILMHCFIGYVCSELLLNCIFAIQLLF